MLNSSHSAQQTSSSLSPSLVFASPSGSQINRRSDQIYGLRAGGGPLEDGSATGDSGASGGWWGFAGGCRRGAPATGAGQAGSSEGLKGAARQHASGQQGGTGQVGCSSQRQHQQGTGNIIRYCNIYFDPKFLNFLETCTTLEL